MDIVSFASLQCSLPQPSICKLPQEKAQRLTLAQAERRRKLRALRMLETTRERHLGASFCGFGVCDTHGSWSSAGWSERRHRLQELQAADGEGSDNDLSTLAVSVHTRGCGRCGRPPGPYTHSEGGPPCNAHSLVNPCQHSSAYCLLSYAMPVDIWCPISLPCLLNQSSQGLFTGFPPLSTLPNRVRVC